MALADYLRVLRRLWWALILIVALGAGVGYGSSLLHTPQYESRAQLFVTTQSGSSVGDAYQNNLFSQQRAVSYAGLATSQQVAARAADQLKTGISSEDLRSRISAAAIENTVLLEITARDSDPATAQLYANAVAVQLVQLVSELETSRRGGTPAAGAVIVDEADFPTTAVGLSLLDRIAFGAAGGFLVAILLIVLAAFADTRTRRKDSVETATRSAVLGALVDDPERSDAAATDLKGGGIAVERLRELRTNLMLSSSLTGRSSVAVAVTSPSRGDGRSTVAIDMAVVIAESGHSVLLVDGDLVRPALADRCGLDGEQSTRAARGGLSTVLRGRDELVDVVIDKPGGLPISFVPAGPAPAEGRQHWASNVAPELLSAMKRNFDYVIIDTPPMNHNADGALIASLGDGAIVLARIGRTKNADLKTSIGALARANAVFLGAVVTCEPGHRRELASERKSARQAAATDHDGTEARATDGKKSARAAGASKRPPADRSRSETAVKSQERPDAGNSPSNGAPGRPTRTQHAQRTRPGSE